MFEARARAELAAADALCPGADTVKYRGALLADVALVKGLPGPAEAAGGEALSGADGEAAAKALEALGWDRAHIFFTLSRPVAALEPARCARRLRAQLEAVDPRVVVALDSEAAEDVAHAFGCDPPRPGRPSEALGRRLVAVNAFEASLGKDTLKRAAWNEIKLAVPPGPVF